MIHRKTFSSLLIMLFMTFSCLLGEEGKFFNPITEICWKCIFPIHLGGINVTPGHKESTSYRTSLCACAGLPPKIGAPLAFWEPIGLIEITRTPYKCHVLGGISLGDASIKQRGAISHVGDSGRHSFYNVHYYKFPILTWLGLLPGFACLEKGADIDIAYISELDPLWNDDEWSQVLNPEAHLFGGPLAQTACIADCAATSLDITSDKLFWCAGCAGSLYPLMGHISHHVGGIQASHLLAHRLLAKMHSLGMISGHEDNDFCDKKLLMRIKKTIYKTQLVHPIANAQGPCNPLGKSDILWGAGKTYPYGGEDFVYLVWKKKHCCLDSVKAASSLVGSPLP